MVYYLFVYSQKNPDRFFTNYPEIIDNKKRGEVDLFASMEDALNFALPDIPKKTLGIIIYQVALKKHKGEDPLYLNIKRNGIDTVYWSAPYSSIQIVSEIQHFAVNPALLPPIGSSDACKITLN